MWSTAVGRWLSSRKWPAPGTRWISASGRSRAKARAPFGPKMRSPAPQQRDATIPEVGVQPRVERPVGGVVAEQGELHQVVAGAADVAVVGRPGVRVDALGVVDAVQVLPADGVQVEGGTDRRLRLRPRVLGVRPQGRPELRDEAVLVGVAALRDHRGDRGRVAQREPPGDGAP